MTPATRTRNRRGEGARLREELLDTAGRMLGELGDVELLSLRGLAAEVGISAPSIYRHFPDKAALLVAVAERAFGSFDAELLDASDNAGDDPFDRLRAVGHAYLGFGAEHPAHYRILFGAVGLPHNRDPADLAGESGRTAFALLVRVMRACLESGPGGDGLDPFVVATEVWAMVHGLVDLPVGIPTFPWPDPEAVADAWVDRLRATVRPAVDQDHRAPTPEPPPRGEPTRGPTMAYSLSCGDVMPGCAAQFEADTEDELLALVAPHAADDHGVTEITPEVLEAVKGAIKQT